MTGSVPSIFECCVPRRDVLEGRFTESDFAADLAAVLRGDAPDEYRDPTRFFAQTYPTEGLKALLKSVCSRLAESGQSVAPIFRLDTNYGGGKTHALIALSHAARGMEGVENASEFIDPAHLPKSPVRVAAFDGENADPNNGRPLGDGLRAYTPWGEIAYALAGREGYERVRRSDEGGAAPGAATIAELFGGEPALILLDELSIYLRKLRPGDRERSGGQLTAFLTGLFKAVESTPNAAVIYTLAIGKAGKATDAYSAENQFIADVMAEAESVSARKATLLDPTEENETVKVLQRRLFESVDEEKARQAVAAFQEIWNHQRTQLPPVGAEDKRAAEFLAGFPFHPELIDTLRNKTATLSNFQRVRGMLRLLGRTVGRLWDEKPKFTHAIQTHDIDLGYEPIRQEIVTRLEQRRFLPAIRADVAAAEGEQPSLAERLDEKAFPGQPPYGSMVARTIFFHTLAFNEQLKGVSKEHLRYAVLGPGREVSFIDDAVTRFRQDSAYLDDRPTVPLRFQAEANINQIIRRQEAQVDQTEVRGQLNDRIRDIYQGSKVFNPIPFAGGPYDVPDDAGNGRPSLVILGYDAADISMTNVVVPELVERIYRHHGTGGDLRVNRNNVIFLLADSDRKAEMRRKMIRHLALKDLLHPERMNELADHQQEKMRELARRSEQELALAIQQCYRHVLYPSRVRLEGAEVDLAHAVIDIPTTSQTPGDGQKHVVQVLRESKKLRLPEDDPDSPVYVRDRTPLKKGKMTIAALRAEFRRDPTLPILVGDDVFLRGLRQGIENGDYVYQSGELTWAQGTPPASIKIDENSYIYTAEYARENGIWPKPEPERPSPGGPDDEAGPGEQPFPPSPEPPGGGMDDGGAGGFPGAKVKPDQQTPTPVSAEGPLKEALANLWDKARSRKMSKVGKLEIQLFEASDGFRVMSLAGPIPKAQKLLAIECDYETGAGATVQVEFNGPVSDAQTVKDFLEPELRAAPEKTVTIKLSIAFDEGLDLGGDEPQKLTERLGKFGSGAAYVSATAVGAST